MARHAPALDEPTYSWTAFRGLPCQHCTPSRRDAGFRDRSPRRPRRSGGHAPARASTRPPIPAPRTAGIDRPRGGVVVVAHQRDRATLTVQTHHVFRFRPPRPCPRATRAPARCCSPPRRSPLPAPRRARAHRRHRHQHASNSSRDLRAPGAAVPSTLDHDGPGETARLRDGGENPAGALRRGDVVEVDSGEVIPATGTVVEGLATVDESAVTGESPPVIREPPASGTASPAARRS